MAQLAQDIINRVAYEIGDESFDIVKKQSYIYDLDRVYREYCSKTRALTGTIGMYGDDVNNEFDLYGPVFDNNSNPLNLIFGDNFIQFFRVEYDGTRAQEVNFEYLLNSRINNTTAGSDDAVIYYAIRYLGKYQRIYFTSVVPSGTLVQFWYYEVPRIGTINALNSAFGLDDKLTDDLVIGLAMVMWKRSVQYWVKEKNMDMAKYCNDRFTISKSEWDTLLLHRGRDVASYREELTPILVEVGNPDEFDDDPRWEIDFNNYD